MPDLPDAKDSTAEQGATGNNVASAGGQDTSEQQQRDQGAVTAYLQELGNHLRQKGRRAYTQADRWLAERLARRGYSRQETRRVLARSSPELMEQAPGQRIGFIRRITERVYRRREQWQERLHKAQHKSANGDGDRASTPASSKTKASKLKGLSAKPSSQQERAEKQPPPSQPTRPKRKPKR